jgi:acyl carrier protein
MLKIFKKRNQIVYENECFDQICKALREVMSKELKELVLKKDTKIETLGIDSIKYINLFISLEEIIGKELEKVVDSIDLSSIKTINDLVGLVKELQKKMDEI